MDLVALVGQEEVEGLQTGPVLEEEAGALEIDLEQAALETDLGQAGLETDQGQAVH